MCAAQPRGLHPPGRIAEAAEMDEARVAAILERMAGKGLCFTLEKDGRTLYAPLPFVPGMFEYQFMRGADTDRDRRIARLICRYKEAFDAAQGVPRESFPSTRVIPVDRRIQAGSRVHTYSQVVSCIERFAPIAVPTCYCRHVAHRAGGAERCHPRGDPGGRGGGNRGGRRPCHGPRPVRPGGAGVAEDRAGVARGALA